MIDTADLYSMGGAEEVVGEALGDKRDNVILASKARSPLGDGPNESGASRYHLIKACEASLRRLKTDHIDLYQIHNWDGVTSVEETLRALEDLVKSGKIRYFGTSNYTAWQMMKTPAAPASDTCSSLSASKFTTRRNHVKQSSSCCRWRSTRRSAR